MSVLVENLTVRYGDLVAVKGNPLKDITLLESIDVVVKGGKIILPKCAALLPQECLAAPGR